MSEMAAKTPLVATMVAHAVTKDGRKVLIEAKGPGTTRLQRRIAAHNSKRWNEGKRSWLL